MNVSLNATDLWNTASNPSDYFRYKIDNKSGEEGSFDWLQSDTTWQQMQGATPQMSLAKFNWSAMTDSAEIDLFVTVPSGEDIGNKQSLITFIAELAQ